MKQARVCDQCHGELPGDAPEELCPECLLKLGGAELGVLVRRQEAGAEDHGSAAAGRKFGNYEVLEKIAQGGMGAVYKARQLNLDRLVALKLLPFGQFSRDDLLQRFRSEASAAAALQHPNIVAVHDVGEHDGQPFFSMDFVEGRTLAELVRDQPLPAKRAAAYLKTIAEAVHYAHQQGILHRDLKPSNILIDTSDQPRITDFGLAKRLGGDSDLTLTGQVLGSPNFMSPEQAEGHSLTIGPASDVYSLGALLYHLLTRQPPFQADTLTTLLKQVLEAEPVPPRSLNPSIPKDLETICLKCLEKEPHRRYATAQALADDLNRFLNREPVLARPIGASGKAWRWCRRQPVRASLIGALALVLVLGMVGISWQWRRAERERDMTVRQRYASDMKVAQFSLEEGNLGGARRLLDNYRPRLSSPSTLNPQLSTDLRGWEWRYLWGLCRSDEQSKLTQQSKGFVNLALSPDGKLLALRQESGNIELWDWKVRRHVGTLTNQGWPLPMAFSPDGKLIASANRDGSGHQVVSFWDVATLQIVRDLPQPSGVASLAFSPDGKLLATFHLEPVFNLWHLPSGGLVTNAEASPVINQVTRIPLFSPDGATLALADNGPNGPIRLIDLKTWATNEILSTKEGNGVTALAISPDGRLLASGHGFSDTAIRLWDAHTCALVASLEGHRGWVTKLVFASNETLYSASADQSIRAWSIKEKRQICRWQGHTGVVRGLALSPDGKALVSCAEDGSVRVWDPQGPHGPRAYVPLPIPVTRYRAPFTSDSRRLITASPTHPVTIWDVETGREIERIAALGTNNSSIALSPDQRLVAVGSFDGTLKVWDLREQCLLKQWRPHQPAIYGLYFFDDGKVLASLAVLPHQKVDLRRWDVASWREIPFGPIDVNMCYGLAQSSDQRLLALTYADKPVHVWDWASGRLEATLVSNGNWNSSWTPTFSPDGRLLAAAVGMRCYVWEVGSWRPLGVLEQPVSGVVSVAFSPDSKRLVTGSQVGGDLQRAVEIWDYVAQRGLLSLRSRGQFTGWIEFSPDGNTLLAQSWDGVVELWHAPSWAEIEAAEKEQKSP